MAGGYVLPLNSEYAYFPAKHEFSHSLLVLVDVSRTIAWGDKTDPVDDDANSENAFINGR